MNWLKSACRYYGARTSSIQTNVYIKGPLSGPTQFLKIENIIKMMKNVFYFMLKPLFVLEIFTFLSWFFGYVEKWLDKKAIANYKIFDVTD